MFILGINAYHADSSACLLFDGKIIAAAEEERFNRIKHCAGFPHNAISYCLNEAGIGIKNVEYIGISKNPGLRIPDKIIHSLRYFSGNSFLNFAQSRILNYTRLSDIKKELKEKFEGSVNAKIYHIDHHLAHASSAFFVSQFEEAAVLTVDGFGDFLSTMLCLGENNKIKTLDNIKFPHSLGILYTAVSQYLGFLQFGDEGKVMALAAYGEPNYVDFFRDIVLLKKSKYFKLNLDYFLHHKGKIAEVWENSPSYSRLYSGELEKKLGISREPFSAIEKKHQDIACSLQFVLEESLSKIAEELYEITQKKYLCIAGGVALNCVANGKILNNSPFEKIFIQPASSDSGTSLGAAFYIWNQLLNKKRNYVMEHVYLGKEYSDSEIENTVKKFNVAFKKTENIEKETAYLINQGKIIGWFQGRMEYGPRALGNRSIIVDPRNKNMKNILNERIKHRENFRPFAPSILKEKVKQYFKDVYESPFMLFNFSAFPGVKEQIPAVLHVDETARIQTVDKKTNEKFYNLIAEFEKLSGIPAVLNTSFNENEPIVMTPEDAINCFLRTNMDYLAIGNFLVKK